MDAKECPHCHAYVSNEAQFCEFCGGELESRETTSSVHTPTPITESATKAQVRSIAEKAKPHVKKFFEKKERRMVVIILALLMIGPLFFKLGSPLLPSPTPSKTPQELAQEYYTQAQSEYLLKNYDAALSFLEDAIREDPALTDAITLREEIIPLRVGQFVWAAKEARDNKDYIAAVSRAQQALQLDGSCVEAAEILKEVQPLADQQKSVQEAEEAAAEEDKKAEISELLAQYQFNGELGSRIMYVQFGDNYEYRYSELMHDPTGAYVEVSQWFGFTEKDQYSSTYKVYDSGEIEIIGGFDGEKGAKKHTKPTHVLTPKENVTPEVNSTPAPTQAVEPTGLNISELAVMTREDVLNVLGDDFQIEQDVDEGTGICIYYYDKLAVMFLVSEDTIHDIPLLVMGGETVSIDATIKIGMTYDQASKSTGGISEPYWDALLSGAIDDYMYLSDYYINDTVSCRVVYEEEASPVSDSRISSALVINNNELYALSDLIIGF